MALKRVVVADDFIPVLSSVDRLIRDSFHVVGLVRDGRAVLQAILGLEPDIAVLDVSMPGMTGIEVAREIRKRADKTPIVFLTAHKDPDILSACLEAGGAGYVCKESMTTDLIPAMNEALAGRVFVSNVSPSSHYVLNTAGPVEQPVGSSLSRSNPVIRLQKFVHD